MFFVFFGQMEIVPENGIAASQVSTVVKNPATNSGDLRDTGFDPWVEKLPWWGNPLPYSCLRILRTEEPGGLHSMESQKVGHDCRNSRPMVVLFLTFEETPYFP